MPQKTSAETIRFFKVVHRLEWRSKPAASLFIHQVLIRLIVNLILLQEPDEEFIVAFWRGYNVSFDAVIARHFRRLVLEGNASDFGGYGVLGNVSECAGHRLDELIKESFGVLCP